MLRFTSSHQGRIVKIIFYTWRRSTNAFRIRLKLNRNNPLDFSLFSYRGLFAQQANIARNHRTFAGLLYCSEKVENEKFLTRCKLRMVQLQCEIRTTKNLGTGMRHQYGAPFSRTSSPPSMFCYRPNFVTIFRSGIASHRVHMLKSCNSHQEIIPKLL